MQTNSTVNIKPVGQDVLNSILSDAQTKTKDVQSSIDEVNQITQKLEAAKAEKDDRQVQILEATLASSIENSKNVTRDVNESALGLKVYFDQLGFNIQSLDDLLPEEQVKISNAEANIEEAEQEVTDLDGAWFFKDSRLSTAKITLEDAQTKLAQIQQEVEQAQRKRVLDADLERTLQMIQSVAAESISILVQNRSSLESEIAVLQDEELPFNLTEVSRLTTSMEQLDIKHGETESRLVEAEALRDEYSPGTTEYVDENAKVIQLKKDLDDSAAEKNEVLAALQKQEGYCEKLQTYITSQKQQLGANRTMTEMLKQEVHQGSKLFSAWLEAKKQATSLEAGDTINSLTTEISIKAAQEMAEIGAASEKAVTEALEKHASFMDTLMQIKDGQAQASYKYSKRQENIHAEIANKYGIDASLGNWGSQA